MAHERIQICLHSGEFISILQFNIIPAQNPARPPIILALTSAGILVTYDWDNRGWILLDDTPKP